MSKTIPEDSVGKKLKDDYKKDLLLSLNDEIDTCLIKYEDIDEAYIYLLDFKDEIIGKAYNKFITIPLINSGEVIKTQKYKGFKDEYTLEMEINDIYLKTISDRLKIYKYKKKAKKDLIANKTYKLINEAIIQSKKSGFSIIEIIDTIKGSGFKDLCLKDLENEVEVDLNVFNQVYIPTINKIIALYKYDYEIEKRKRKEESKQNFINIPWEWKFYGIAKGFNLFTRHAKKNRL